MADLQLDLLKLLTMNTFQRSPRPKVTVGKLESALGKIGVVGVTQADLVSALQLTKGRGYANTQPKILLPNELTTAEFEIWITPLGRDYLSSNA